MPQRRRLFCERRSDPKVRPRALSNFAAWKVVCPKDLYISKLGKLTFITKIHIALGVPSIYSSSGLVQHALVMGGKFRKQNLMTLSKYQKSMGM